MLRRSSLAVTLLFALTVTAQNKIRPLTELINTTDPGWSIVSDLIRKATNKVVVLPVDTVKAADALYKTQVTTRSPMGAVIYGCGGILVDDGWIRILGSGSPKLTRSVPDWNHGKSYNGSGEAPTFLLIADDAIGGFFILNGGRFGKDMGKVYYFSPDNLEYESLNITYTEFLQFCFNNDLDKFYEGKRWENWRSEVSGLSGDKVFNFFPYLWSKEGKNINEDTRKVVPIEEQYRFNLDMRKQIGLDK